YTTLFRSSADLVNYLFQIKTNRHRPHLPALRSKLEINSRLRDVIETHATTLSGALIPYRDTLTFYLNQVSDQRPTGLLRATTRKRDLYPFTEGRSKVLGQS